VRWYFWVFGWDCGDESRWVLRGSEGEDGGALGSSHSARVHGALTAATHHTPASSSSSQVNGYTPPVDAMRMYPRCHASRGGQCASGMLLGGLGGRLVAEKGQVCIGYVTRMCPFRPRSRHMQHIPGQYWEIVFFLPPNSCSVFVRGTCVVHGSICVRVLSVLMPSGLS
jgi:hypothetical protein